MPQTTIDLPVNTWVLIFTSATTFGRAYIPHNNNDDLKPTRYVAYEVPAGDPAPTVGYKDGVPFFYGIEPQNDSLVDIYAMAIDNPGRLVVLT